MNGQEIKRLLETVDLREEPDGEVRQRTRDAARRVWAQLPASPARPSRAPWYGATVVAVGVGLAALAWVVRSPGPPAVAGEVAYATGGHAVADNDTLDAPLLSVGSSVETSETGRVLIRLRRGGLVRLDNASEVTLRASRRLALARGRLFVDSTGAGVDVESPGGVHVVPVGTQFEVAVDQERVEVAVRDGRVDVHVGDSVVPAAADKGLGEAVVVVGTRLVSRRLVAGSDSRWDWIHGAMPAFELDGATVLEFLDWAAREAGLALEFVSPRARRRAETVVLSGPAFPAARAGRDGILAILETAPSFQIAPSAEHRLVVGLAPELGTEPYESRPAASAGTR